ncbi:MAG: glycosyltransferase family 2 protein [Ruminococcaceae bacterium]|nr:glycosyltransferase family 2 protein [Oscillospiraceae bacterium]
MKISLIVPCYNEEESLKPFYDELNKVSADLADYEFEFLFIDDGSRDKTLSILKDFAKSDERVKYIAFSKNFGKEAAMYAGFCNSSGDYTAVMDADMQDPPSLLKDMLKILEEGEYDSVATRRNTRSGEPKIRSFFAKMFYRIMGKISKVDIISGARDFRLMKRDMVDAIVAMCENNRFSKGIFGWIGFKTYWMSYDNVERVAGETKWSFRKLFNYSLDGIVGFSDVPLKFATFNALLSYIISVCPLALAIVALVQGESIKYSYSLQWYITLFVIFALCGTVLLSIAVVGKYIAKIYDEVKGRPHYIVAQTNKTDIVKK